MFKNKTYRAYLESSKPRVVLLMIFTSFIGMLLADPLRLNFEVIILGNLGIALMSLSAGSINQLLDQKIDSIMQRTKKGLWSLEFYRQKMLLYILYLWHLLVLLFYIFILILLQHG